MWRILFCCLWEKKKRKQRQNWFLNIFCNYSRWKLTNVDKRLMLDVLLKTFRKINTSKNGFKDKYESKIVTFWKCFLIFFDLKRQGEILPKFWQYQKIAIVDIFIIHDEAKRYGKDLTWMKIGGFIIQVLTLIVFYKMKPFCQEKSKKKLLLSILVPS